MTTRSFTLRTGAAFAVAVFLAACPSPSPAPAEPPTGSPKLYWLIPDGLRADPDLFTLFEWAKAGKLPNIKKMIEQGAHGYSIPDFPSHTPTNFASLLTGTHPLKHGVADGPMHTEGAPLTRPSLGGFSSVAKRVPPVWKLLEAENKKVALLSMPGSTPPELERGITVRGRWGGWGADTPAVIFEPEELLPTRRDAGKAFKLFFLGQRLTEFVASKAGPDGSRHAQLSAYGFTLDAKIVRGATGFDTVQLSSGKDVWWTMKAGETSSWKPVTLMWKEQSFASDVRARVIKVWSKEGHFRVRLFFNNVNRLNAQPPEVATTLTKEAGPMVDFADNWPPQLIYEPEDQAVFFEEAQASLAWHAKAAGVMLKNYQPDVFLQDTYTPNQMLESRWWHRHVDPARPGHDPARAKEAWADLEKLYQGIDTIMGEAMKAADPNTLFVLSSDHGVIPLYKQVRINNLFAKKGWLKFTVDKKTGEPAIDWAKTTVIYLKMAHVYVNPKGLAGDWHRASGPEYEKLRTEAMAALAELKDDNGTKPLAKAVTWQEAPRYFNLPTDRVGDIVLQVEAGYTWWEEVSEDGKLFTEPLTSGYKQTVNARELKGMWTPFVIMGPGIKAGVTLEQPISHVDQLPTILTALGVKVPAHVDGKTLTQVLSPR